MNQASFRHRVGWALPTDASFRHRVGWALPTDASQRRQFVRWGPLADLSVFNERRAVSGLITGSRLSSVGDAHPTC
jgi:hypothetical protein